MKYTLFALFFLLALPFCAQQWKDIEKNPDYIYAEGRGYSIDDADKEAIEGLISQISMHVSNKTTSTGRLTQHNGNIEENSQFESTLKTYSNATLTNTMQEIIDNEPNARVARWIKRSEIERIFQGRIDRIKDLVNLGLRAKREGRVDDALRQLYWALILLKSVRYPNEVKHRDEAGEEHLLVTWIPDEMNSIFSQIKTSIAKRNGDVLEVFITYKDKPVSSIEYSYNEEGKWTPNVTAKDGIGEIEIEPGSKAEQIQIKYEYEFRNQAKSDRELESVLESVKSIPMKSAWCNLTLGNRRAMPTPAAAQARASFSEKPASMLQAPASAQNSADYQTILEKVADAIQRKDYTSVRPLFTENGWDVYTKLIQYGKARIVGTPSYSFYNHEQYVIGRGLHMAFSFARGVHKSFTEDVVFTFTRDRKIHNISFGLGNLAADDILNNKVWSEPSRVAVMNFLENYKTAYALKRLDYIESIFDDDAVIIVGNVAMVQQAERDKDGGLKFNTKQILKKTKYDKEQYLRNLKQCFNSNEFINIHFANNDVYKSATGGEVYGIQIAQDYYSTNYADRGYLFLMVDINNPNEPIIKVRTWQPEKDPDFGIYSLGDF